MAKQYYSVLTTYGAQLFAQAMANKRPVTITHMAVGDGNGKSIQPDSTRTTLFREVHRATISAVSTDPRNNKQVIFELTIPEAVGGFYIREMGIFDATGKMVAMANCPETYKPRLDEGSGKVQVLRMVLLVSSSDAVTITVDDSVIFATRGQLTPKTLTGTSTNAVNETGHTHEIDKASTTQAGLVQLVDNLTSADNSKALTAAQGKALNDKLDNTQIGGRNLLIGSRLIRNKEGTDYYSLPQNVDYAAIRHLVLSADFDVVNFKRVEIQGATTRIGLEIKLDYTDGTYQYVGLWKANQSTTQAISVQGRQTYLFNVPANKTIARISSAFTQIKAATADKMVVSYPKVEIGNKATDWTPAPEDRDFIKIPQNSTPVTLNLTNKAALTAYLDQLGNGVLQQTHYQFVLANNSADNITGLPLGDKAAVQLDLSVRSGVSILSCHYLNNNRKFSALVDFNKADYSINWQEELKMTDGWVKTPLKVENSVEAKSYFTLKRLNASDLSQPAVILDNQAADLSLPTLPRDVVLGDMRFLANGGTRIYWRGVLKQDKNTTLAAILKNAEGGDKYPLVLNSAGAVGINGSTGSNTTDKLVINGTAAAVAPPNEANNAQLVTSAWVRRNFLPRTVTGSRELIFANNNQPIYRVNNPDGSWWQTGYDNPANGRKFHFTHVTPGEPYRYITVTFPHFDSNQVVAYQSYVNEKVVEARNWVNANFANKNYAMDKRNFKVMTGTIANGASIPLPAGFEEHQCKWFAAPEKVFDVGGNDLNSFQVLVEGRVVKVLSEGQWHANNRARYLIIGWK